MFRMQHPTHIAKLYRACVLLTISVLASACLSADTGLRLPARASSVSGTSTQPRSDMSRLEVEASASINSDEDLKTRAAKHKSKLLGLARTLLNDRHALIPSSFLLILRPAERAPPHLA